MEPNDNKKDSELATKIKAKLAEVIGVEVEDIKEEDIFSDDLHMSASDFTDFLTNLDSLGIDHSGLELTGNDSVGELIEQVSAQFVE